MTFSLRRLLHRSLGAGLILALLLPMSSARPAAAQGGFNMPDGFLQDTIVVGLELPTSFAMAPDGRIYVAEKSGKVRIVQDGQLLPDPFIDLSNEVNDASDRGLLGIALHPDWPSTPYVYLAYTYDPPEIKDRNPAGARVSRVLRLSADPDNLNVAQVGSGMVILGAASTAEHIGNPDEGDTLPFSCFDDAGSFVRDCIANEGTAHSLGNLTFGRDGALYVSSGDGIVNSKGNSRALDINSLNGKILRIDPITGEGFASNPFFDGDAGSNRSKVFALGMRNPFRFTVDPRNGQLIMGDVGNNNWEEINRGGAGANFGWPCYEGPYEAATYANCDAFKNGEATVTDAIFAYPHSNKNPQRGSAIGGDLYFAKVFPPLYRGAYFYHDFNGGVVNFLTFAGDGSAVDNEFATNVPGIVQMTTGDDGAMYVLSVILGGIWRIRYAPSGNKPPTAAAAADPAGGEAPLAVQFSSKRSSDPEKSLVGFRWEFGDGTTSSKANPTHTYAEDGQYTAKLTVTDSAGATSSDSLAITIGHSDAAHAVTLEAPQAKPAAVARDGAVTAERWNGVSGETIEEFTKSRAFRSDPPSATTPLAALDLPRGGNEYGVRVRGYLLPPVDGDYRFWIAADDRGVLSLSTDASPDNKIVIAFTPEHTAVGDFDHNPQQATGPIGLEAGKRYYFEILYKQNDGKDHLSVAWQIPGRERTIIDGKYLAPYQP